MLCNHLADGAQSRSCGRFKPRFGGTNLALNTIKAILIGPLAAILNFASKPDCNIFRRGKYDKLIGEYKGRESRKSFTTTLIAVEELPLRCRYSLRCAGCSLPYRSLSVSQSLNLPVCLSVCLSKGVPEERKHIGRRNFIVKSEKAFE